LPMTTHCSKMWALTQSFGDGHRSALTRDTRKGKHAVTCQSFLESS